MTSPHYENAARVLRTPDVDPAELHAAAVELCQAFVRNEHSIGLLPGDAPDLLVQTLRAAGDRGNVPALLDLALLYERGGIAPWAPFPAHDSAAAISLYRAADELGDRDGALGWVRTAYFARDESEASAAATRLGVLHAQDPENAELMLFLGYFLHQGYGYAEDAAAGTRFFEAAAARGDAAAAFELSILTSDGGVTDASVAWTHRAAELGSDRAQSNLGGMYATGRGVTKDTVQAMQWYARAGEAGNARAAFIAGLMLLTGDEGLDPDPASAVELFSLADELGFDVDASLEGMGLARPE
ncbi:tetratricopeptide repeat protein [Microbacterium sp. USHLN272]|uniref:tetratricopeptide repeat protein n=1 Tax=Microbacterium sp. USHLN272 TaxID=3081287 RepID=UPI003015F18F